MCLDIGPFVWALEGHSIGGRIFPVLLKRFDSYDSFGLTGRLRLGP